MISEGKEGPAPAVDAARCTGCGRCVAACRKRLLSLETSGFKKHAVRSAQGRCSACRACLAACPVHAISDCPGGDGA